MRLLLCNESLSDSIAQPSASQNSLCKLKPEGLTLLYAALSAAVRRGCAAIGKRGTRLTARADEAHQPRGRGFRREAGLRRRVQRRGAGLVGGIPTQAMRPHMRLDAQYYAERGITGGVGMRRSAANAPVQPWAVPAPQAKHTITESAGARSGRPRRQSCDCREGRTQATTALSVLGAWLGR